MAVCPAQQLCGSQKNKRCGLFQNKNEADLSEKLIEKLSHSHSAKAYDLAAYNWGEIAVQTGEVYRYCKQKKQNIQDL